MTIIGVSAKSVPPPTSKKGEHYNGRIISAQIMTPTNGDVGLVMVIKVTSPKSLRNRTAIFSAIITGETLSQITRLLAVLGLTIAQQTSGDWEKLLPGRTVKFTYVAPEGEPDEVGYKIEQVTILEK